MARIAGVNIPLNKRVEIGLTYIYGIGRSTSNKLLARGRRSSPTPTSATSPRTRSSSCATRSTTTSRSRATCAASARRTSSACMEIGCYRGLRHRRGLPVRGQNTKTNARTRKGPKRMQVAGKKKAGKK